MRSNRTMFAGQANGIAGKGSQGCELWDGVPYTCRSLMRFGVKSNAVIW